MRERFKETFKPLIKTQEAVKTSIDKQQNEMIKQLKDNQLALTKGLEGNRLALTSGFDKMEIKESPITSPLSIEGEKTTSKPMIKRDEISYKVANRDLNKISGFKVFDENDDAFFKKEELEDFLKRNSFCEKK